MRYDTETTSRLTAYTTLAVCFNNHCRAAEGKDPARPLRQIRHRDSHPLHTYVMITEMADRGSVLLLRNLTRWRIGKNDN